jgi:hypothetical protein
MTSVRPVSLALVLSCLLVFPQFIHASSAIVISQVGWWQFWGDATQ